MFGNTLIFMRGDYAYDDVNIGSAYVIKDDFLILLIQVDDETFREEILAFRESIIFLGS